MINLEGGQASDQAAAFKEYGIRTKVDEGRSGVLK